MHKEIVNDKNKKIKPIWDVVSEGEISKISSTTVKKYWSKIVKSGQSGTFTKVSIKIVPF